MKFIVTSICVAGYTFIASILAVPHGHRGRNASTKSYPGAVDPPLTTGSSTVITNVTLTNSTSPFTNATFPITNGTSASRDANSTLHFGNATFPIANGTLAPWNATSTLTIPLPSAEIVPLEIRANKPTGYRSFGFSTAATSAPTLTAVYNATSPSPTNVTVISLPANTTTNGTELSPPTSTASSNSPAGQVRFGGVNIAGFDFGCNIWGSCNTGGIIDIVTNGDGIQQMQHFISNDGLNAFRLPVGWQYLVDNGDPGQNLDATNLAKYDELVRGCLDAGAEMCMIDIHNYAHYNGAVIGQGGPNNDQFAYLWSQLAKKYANESRVAFDIMNEPHDLNIDMWANTAQAAVTAIRTAGATSQIILLPGTSYTSAAAFVDTKSAAALSKVVNLDGSTDNLVFNVHKYLDSSGDGTSSSCVTNNIESSFSPLAEYLRANGRQAMLTETGGGPTDEGCMTYLCEQMDFLNENSDVYLGVVTWAAGGFTTGYEILQTPIKTTSDTLVDQPLVSACVTPKLGKKAAAKRWVPPLQ